ncbi:DUF3244 domain-containing protein [Bacteroides sp. 224]|uniref:DUF3244 domain-containing protein n=1 Tax=Bacteroides sp. 224 TaxID=2302936 RepID=UPI0013D0F862|nr:DUF3244 domain-containing protein [Bacteroides sp. 224]
MRTLFYLLLCITLVGGASLKAGIENNGRPKTISMTGIYSKGNVDRDEIPTDHPFFAELEDPAIYIQSAETVTDLTVSIVQDGALVEEQTFSSITEYDLAVTDLSTLDNGDYTLVITTPQGTYLEGDFTLE